VRSVLDIAFDGEADEALDEAELLPAVDLPPGAELAAAVRAVPLFDAALRLADWCEAGRKITPKGVLKPALARQAVRDLELWRLDPERPEYEDEDVREAALEAIRSAGDLPLIDDPWQLACAAGLIETNSTTARSGPQRPASGDDGALLECWADALGEELYDLYEQGPVARFGVLGAVMEEALPGSGQLVAELLQILYCLPDGEWLEGATVLAAALEGLPVPAASLLRLVLGDLQDELTEVLRRFGAAETAGTRALRDRDSAVMGILFGSPAVTAIPQPDSGRRMRLTPLGRYGVRQLMLEMGHDAPVVGQYADSDAATLLDVLPAYAPDAAERETAGWLARRSPPDAAVQLLDACAGMGADASGRRRMALPLLARSVNADERALRVLRKAAASDVEGCRQIAAGALNLRGEEVPGHDETTMVWLLIDNLVLPEAVGPEDVVAFLDGEGGQIRDRLPELADVLWRSDHPATAEVLGILGEAVRSVDKKLAKRLRTSANKARSHR
jgi:hypothetical protein